MKNEKVTSNQGLNGTDQGPSKGEINKNKRKYEDYY